MSANKREEKQLMKLAHSLLVLVFLFFGIRAIAADQPQWGQAWSRNMISSERQLPDSFDPKTGKNIKWSAKLGTQTFSTPIVAGGRVYIGTNNEEPRNPKYKGDRGVMLCFAEKTGKLLWQLVVPKREDDPFCDWPKTGMSSPVTVEGNRVYLVNNRGEVMCLDARGMANGNDGPFRGEAIHMVPKIVGEEVTRLTNSSAHESLLTSAPKKMQPGPTDADIRWLFDLTSGAGIWSHDAAHSSILIDGDFLYLNTGTGVDNTHKVIRTPSAPSLVVLNKKTGKFVARDNENIAPNIFHATWSSPAMGKVAGRNLIFFCGGNGVVYAFEPLATNFQSSDVAKLKKVWQFDFDPSAPKTNVHQYSTNRRESPSNIYGMPVFHRERLYVAGGGDIFWGKNEAWLKCIDATKTGDITTQGLVWSYSLEKHVLSTPAVYNDCVFIADCGRKVHCVDAKTGEPFWTHEIHGEVWASPLVADGKVYLGTRNGDFWIFAANKEKKILGKVEIGTPINATATIANGVLYVATMSHLYAVEEPE
ncbi:MAG: PQQ-binding-like beta-propeller repeat protein [Verrucomicrobiota bacterium]